MARGIDTTWAGLRDLDRILGQGGGFWLTEGRAIGPIAASAPDRCVRWVPLD